MLKRNFSSLILAFTVVFTVQIFDIPPIAHALNPKTCCGRTICLCHHPQGAQCPFRLQKERQLKRQENPSMPQAPVGEKSHKECPFHSKSESKTISPEKVTSGKGILLSKAPCDSDAPKSFVPGFSKDFTVVDPFTHFELIQSSLIFISKTGQPLPLRGQGIERPPRLF